jgi:anti-sigma regulatory factor (Ser/Thr protein kinase)
MLSAYNEAFNNIVEHAYADAADDVEVTLHVEEDSISLRLMDQGEGFNFDLAGARDTPPDFETLSEGGMGLFIIRKAMTEVTYERRHNRNLLTGPMTVLPFE